MEEMQTFVDPDATPTGKAFMNATSASELGAGVANALPHAEGSFGYSTTASPGNDQELFWASNHVTNPTPNSYLRLATSSPLAPTTSPRLVAVKPFDHDANPATAPIGLSGRTTTLTQPSRVLADAVMSVGRVLLLPTEGGPGAFVNQLIDVSRPLIVIDNSTARVDCDARRTGSSSNSSGSWSATLRYWTDLQPIGSGDGVATGAYSAPVTLGFPQPSGQPTLASIKAQNAGKGPLVYDANLSSNDVYLFESSGAKGYLESWSGLSTIATSTSPDGKEVTAQIDGAIRLAITETDSGVNGSNMSVLLGNLNCQAVDRR